MTANPAFTQAAPCSPDALTAVELTWIEKRVEHWIRVGRDDPKRLSIAAAVG
jgi:hypothetical protein